MAELLPRFTLDRIEDERRLAKIILEADGTDDEKPALTRASADGHHWERRRGLPLIGKGIGGAMRGTDPLGALIAKESRQRRH